MEKLPPIEKIYEAYSAITDGRVKIGDKTAEVISSGKNKTYKVEWQDNVYSSNDNGTYWQGYAGYPVIAVLMMQGKLPFNKEVASELGGINWNRLNLSFKNKYPQVIKQVLTNLENKGADIGKITSDIAEIYHKLENIDIICKRGKRLKVEN